MPGIFLRLRSIITKRIYSNYKRIIYNYILKKNRSKYKLCNM